LADGAGDLGVDGVFTDFADTALEARGKYLQELGR
jgi:glycerophosphoryl diester phosphodiesterase